MASTLACRAEDPGSIPGEGVLYLHLELLIVGRAIVLFFEDFFGLFLALVVGFALMFILYLFLITKILPLFKF